MREQPEQQAPPVQRLRVRYAKRGVHGAYWLRVTCFAQAAREGVSVGSACRKVRGKREIARILREQKRPMMMASAPTS